MFSFSLSVFLFLFSLPPTLQTYVCTNSNALCILIYEGAKIINCVSLSCTFASRKLVLIKHYLADTHNKVMAPHMLSKLKQSQKTRQICMSVLARSILSGSIEVIKYIIGFWWMVKFLCGKILWPCPSGCHNLLKVSLPSPYRSTCYLLSEDTVAPSIIDRVTFLWTLMSVCWLIGPVC